MDQIGKLIILLGCLALTACQSAGSRAPVSMTEEAWSELELANPGQASTFQRAQAAVSENVRKLELLNRCGLKRFNQRGQALERDLLLIRARSISERRFEEIYRGRVSVHERACLIADQVGV